jgi:hypothetical protein
MSDQRLVQLEARIEKLEAQVKELRSRGPVEVRLVEGRFTCCGGLATWGHDRRCRMLVP